MKYMLLIYGSEADRVGMTAADEQAEMAAYSEFSEEVRRRNAGVASEALHLTNAATTVRVRDGKVLTTDGPFAETREALGGFYLVDVQNLDEAIELASKIPGALNGSVEIRPVMVFG